VDSLKTSAKSGRYRDIVDFHLKKKIGDQGQVSMTSPCKISMAKNYFLQKLKYSRVEGGPRSALRLPRRPTDKISNQRCAAMKTDSRTLPGNPSHVAQK